MAILEPPRSGSSLNQGDLLKGMNLFLTGSDWVSTGGSAEQVEGSSYCMVVSRPCACVYGQKPQILVVSVEEFRTVIPDSVSTFTQYQKYFSLLRDGKDMPDRFYLGLIPGVKTQRYAARLDSFHTVTVPDSLQEFDQFVQDNRVASLSIDFQRDLHLRIFRVFSELGFDNCAWYETNDLQMVIGSGEKERIELELEHQRELLNLQHLELKGDYKQQHKASLEKTLAKLKSQIEEIKEELLPFQRELESRLASVQQTTS